jgi:cell division protein FtsB|tara:strand:- start:56 stop:445 length:390 start_codon:yes stop_codon:yes gene_type:complete
MKSRETICPDCRGKKGKNRYRVMSNKTQDAIATIENMDKEIENLKLSIDVLHSTIEVEVQHQLTKGIEPIIEKILDEKISELKDVIISSMTKSQKAQKDVEELTKLMKGYKSSNTRMKNKMKKFEERFA